MSSFVPQRNMERCVNLFIRPMRDTYEVETEVNDLVEPVTFMNRRQLKLVGTIYKPKKVVPSNPVLIVCHGNSCNQYSAYTTDFQDDGVTVFAFDFAGCGMSEGEYITLGFNEKFDILDSIEFLKTRGYNNFGLYGRSMGAATSIMAAALSTDIKFLVLDSPYTSGPDFLKRFIDVEKGETREEALEKVRNAILEKVPEYDILVHPTTEFAPKINIPVMIIHGQSDKLVLPEQSEDLLNLMPSQQKERILTKGDHNSFRFHVMEQMNNFIFKQFDLPEEK